jgi:CTP:molybdopterin cytidylyltransferase MocA
MRLGALLLAAGGAVRFGSSKLCAQVDGKAVISHSIDALLPVFGDNLYCVLGSYGDRVGKLVQDRCHLLYHEG